MDSCAQVNLPTCSALNSEEKVNSSFEMWRCVAWQQALCTPSTSVAAKWLAAQLFSAFCCKLCEPDQTRDLPFPALVTLSVNEALPGPFRSKVETCELMCMASVLVAGKRLATRSDQFWVCDLASKDGHSFDDILRAERHLLRVLQWEVNQPTPYTVANRIISHAGTDSPTQEKVRRAVARALDLLLQRKELFNEYRSAKASILGWAAALYAFQVASISEDCVADISRAELSSTMACARECKEEIAFLIRQPSSAHSRSVASPAAVQHISTALFAWGTSNTTEATVRVEENLDAATCPTSPPQFGKGAFLESTTHICPTLKRPRAAKPCEDGSKHAKRAQKEKDESSVWTFS